MASVHIMVHLLECDGCKTIFGTRAGFGSGLEARSAAYSAGWRFPAKLGAKGKQTNRASDVCPSCLPDWKSESWQGTGSHRTLTQAEAAELIG